MLQLTSLVTVIRNIIKEYYACIIIRHIFTFNRKIYPMFIYLIISWYSIIMQKLYCTCGNFFLDINYFSLRSLILRIRYPFVIWILRAHNFHKSITKYYTCFGRLFLFKRLVRIKNRNESVWLFWRFCLICPIKFF